MSKITTGGTNTPWCGQKRFHEQGVGMDQELHLQKLREAYMSACDLIVNGKYEQALDTLVWLHDNPLPDILPSEMYRRVYGFMAWGELAYLYPPAKQKMEEVLAKKIEAAKYEVPSKSIKADIGRLKGILSELVTSTE
ncbi:hypothetical protein RBA41_31950 [Massilia sp. CCM 9210]|uniref:hypothetical protein n=1 Tax=Massilia scottii TaxID=3057166 RepID=UPI002796BB54|nr:hypothetical protein [Massilia sp. CCM 9210]MDQ1817924.1 hypothetical protein [Massilia sp. CCM 9210]